MCFRTRLASRGLAASRSDNEEAGLGGAGLEAAGFKAAGLEEAGLEEAG